jgi:hypothetical protein
VLGVQAPGGHGLDGVREGGACVVVEFHGPPPGDIGVQARAHVLWRTGASRRAWRRSGAPELAEVPINTCSTSAKRLNLEYKFKFSKKRSCR